MLIEGNVIQNRNYKLYISTSNAYDNFNNNFLCFKRKNSGF